MVSCFGCRMDGGCGGHPAGHAAEAPVVQLCCLSRTSSCPDFVKQLLSCVGTAWWGAARHGQTSSQLPASFTNEAFRQPCSSHGQWWKRSTGGGWAIPCLLGCCHRRGGMRWCSWPCPPPAHWLQGSVVGSCLCTFHLASYAEQFWRHSRGLGGLFASTCS